MDEALCTVDLNWRDNMGICDDELRATLFLACPEGVELVAFFDSCHSGTMSDMKPVRVATAAQTRARQKKYGGKTSGKDDLGRYCPPPEFAQERASVIRAEMSMSRPLGVKPGQRRAEAMKRASAANNRIVCLSACRDEQTSKDDTFEGVRMGAFTWALHRVLKEVGMHSGLMFLVRRVRFHLSTARYPSRLKRSVTSVTEYSAFDARLIVRVRSERERPFAWVQETLDEAGYPQMPQLSARLGVGEHLEDYHFFESLQEAADAVRLAEALPNGVE